MTTVHTLRSLHHLMARARPAHRDDSPARRVTSPVLVVFLVVGVVLALGLSTTRARAAAPSAPGSFAVSSVTSSSAVLSWTASPGAIGYRVYRDTTAAAGTTLINTADESVLKYTAANLRSKTAYKFAVAALGADGSASSLVVKAATTTTSTDTTAPSAPASTTMQATAFSSSRIDVIWGASPSSDVAYYEVLRGGVVVATVDRPMATKFSDNGLTASTTYSYQVRAVDSAGNRSALTTTKSPKTLAPGTVQIARGPYSVKVGATSATIAWWTNIPTTGQVSIGGAAASDTATTVAHKVAVTGLTAGKQYSYTVSSGGATATGTVRTAKKAGQPYTFAVLGDYGAGSTAEQQNATHIAGFNSDFVQTVGDNIYPSSGFPDPNFTTTYSDLDARIFKQLAPVFDNEAFFPANGNHEYYANGQFWNAFPMPGSNHSWYSYNWGDAHILVLDSMSSVAAGSAQYTFASADLSSSAAQSAAWRIVIVPNPPNNSTTSPTGGSADRGTIVPLFDSKNVDLVLSGDAHNYQRSKPISGTARTVDPKGVTYIVSGGGGNGLNAFTSGTLPSWQAFRQSTFESLKVEVSPTALKVSAIGASGGAVIDSVSLSTSAP